MLIIRRRATQTNKLKKIYFKQKQLVEKELMYYERLYVLGYG